MAKTAKALTERRAKLNNWCANDDGKMYTITRVLILIGKILIRMHQVEFEEQPIIYKCVESIHQLPKAFNLR